MKEAAIFDIDKTLIDGNTGMMHVWHLFFKGMIRPLDAAVVNFCVFRYLMNSIDYEDALRRCYGITKGWDKKRIERIFSRFYKEKVKKRLYVEMEDEIRKHKQEGRKIVFATNAWDLMVKGIVDRLKPDHLIATRIKEKDGKLTGRVTNAVYADKKAEQVRAWAEKNDIDLKKSYAYSDHASDLPLLELVGNPVAVNPDRKLKSMAEKKGWRVIQPDTRDNI